MAINVSLGMYSVREIMHLEPLGAVENCAKAGFHYLYLPTPQKTDELGMVYGQTVKAWKKTMENAGVEIVGGYVPSNLELAESYIDFYAELGAKQVIIPIDYFPSGDVLKQNCELYNQLGAVCKNVGLDLLYENHYHEFQIIDGKKIMDTLLEETDKELFSIALNSYWMMRGLVDPLEFLKKNGKRVKTIIQQDYPLSEIDKFNMWRFDRYHPIAQNINFKYLLKGNEIENIHPVQSELFCEIGEGIIALQPIIDLANQFKNIRYVMLKQDYTHMDSEYDSVAMSAKNYRSVRDVNWR